ncbi:MAG: CCA tRNA nucleotidyltransferase [Lachnospiraceae bacterium]|nr:CCA tRNA nucleotidyltransferase [Lachnospiraceae bacterium]
MHITLPTKVKQIISRLEKADFEAYAVGGCVRDSILLRSPEDWDITTSAKPEEVKKLFSTTIDTGLQHGTVTVVIEKEGFEVTTFRLDGDYTDGRHPDRVAFTSSLTEDLRRRDFTINAMAYSEKTGLIDEFDGERDLEDGIIRAVGEAKERFSEDALRMLRAIRFAGQLNFKIEEKTFDAIKELSSNISKVSVERIAKELEKLLLSGNPEYIALVYETGIFSVIAPEVAMLFENCEISASIKALSRASFPEKKELYQIRLAIFLEGLGADKAAKLLKRLKLDNDTINTVKKLLELSLREVENNETDMRRTVKEAGYKMMPLLLEMRRAKGLKDNKDLYQTVIDNGYCTSISELNINGKDLMDAGIPKGALIGSTLERLLELVIEKPELNTRESLLLEVRRNEE